MVWIRNFVRVVAVRLSDFPFLFFFLHCKLWWWVLTACRISIRLVLVDAANQSVIFSTWYSRLFREWTIDKMSWILTGLVKFTSLSDVLLGCDKVPDECARPSSFSNQIYCLIKGNFEHLGTLVNRALVIVYWFAAALVMESPGTVS